MAFSTQDIPNLSGKTALVTGANSGLGFETSRALAGAGATVLLAARNPDKAAAAVNHLGHFALTAHLLPALLRAPAARVVSVTSTAHHMGKAVDPDNPHLDGCYGEWRAYGQSKLANYHFALGLQQRFEEAGVSAASLVAHPGLSNTNLQATSVKETGGGLTQRFFHGLAGRTGMSPAQGALPQIRAATDPRAKGGQFYAPRFVNFGAAVLRPVLRQIGMRTAIERLWLVSERETGVALDVGAALAAI